MLEEADIRLVKLWLDISKKEQAERLEARRDDPLKALKVSDLDGEAQKKWKDYSKARNEMLLRTSTEFAPWTCVHTDHKKEARLNIIRHLLHDPGAGRDPRATSSRRTRTCSTGSSQAALTDGRLEK